MNKFTKGLRALACTLGAFVSIGLSTTAVAQEQQPAASTAAQSRLPANYIDCAQYTNTGYADEDGNDKADGVTARALARTSEENNRRLCSGLPIYTGDLRMPIMSIWDRTTNMRFSVFGDRPNGHQDNGTTRMGWITYPGSPTPINPTPMFAELATTTNGNATLGRAAAQVLPAATNGLGASVANNLLSPCRSGGCGNTGSTIVNMVDGAEAIAMQSATSGAAVDVGVALGGTCGSTCGGSTTASPSSGDAPNAAMVNPSGQGIE